MQQEPAVWTITSLTHHIVSGPETNIPGTDRWVPARPLPFSHIFHWLYRLKLAWKVFKGEYDALNWEQ